MLLRWRKDRDALTKTHLVKKRGPKTAPVNPLAEENRRLVKALARSEARLKKAELVIELQKKVARLLGEPYVPGELGEDD